MSEYWFVPGVWLSAPAQSLVRALRGRAAPALRSLMGSVLVGACLRSVKDYPRLLDHSLLQVLCLDDATVSVAKTVLDALPNLSVFDLKCLVGRWDQSRMPPAPEVPRLQTLLAPAHFGCWVCQGGARGLRSLLLRVQDGTRADLLSLAQVSSSLAELHILDSASNSAFTLQRVFADLQRVGLRLRRFVHLQLQKPLYLRKPPFANLLVALRQTMDLQSLRFACVSINEVPSRPREDLEEQVARLAADAPELELWVPDWPGEPPATPAGATPGRFGLQLGAWASRLVNPITDERVVYSKLPPLHLPVVPPACRFVNQQSG